jgi:hypothetical protein
VSANDLLLWMSARQTGSWQQFRGAVEELHMLGRGEADDLDPGAEGPLPLHQELRFSLERLGHVEFGSHDNYRWRVVPPGVAFLPDKREAVGVLCGARSPQTLDQLRTLPDTRVEVAETEGMPDRIMLRSGSEDVLAEMIRRLGLLVQHSAALTLLAAVPSVRDQRGWVVSEMPATPGWTVHRFSRSQLKWIEIQSGGSTSSSVSGLFRFAMKHQRFYYVVNNGRCFRVPVQVGKFAVLPRRRGVLRYDPRTQVLSVRPICRPPLLIERALVLCSGSLPSINNLGRLEYRDVPHDTARLAADVLFQELE